MDESNTMLAPIFTVMSDNGLAEWVRSSLWGYPICETIHLFGVMLLFGSIAMVDLRFLGLGRNLSFFDLGERHLLRFTWAGFLLILLSGLALFSAYPFENMQNPIFLVKMGLIAAAGVNMLFFKFRVTHGLVRFSTAEAGGVAAVDEAPPMAARLSAGLSIGLWTSGNRGHA